MARRIFKRCSFSCFAGARERAAAAKRVSCEQVMNHLEVGYTVHTVVSTMDAEEILNNWSDFFE